VRTDAFDRAWRIGDDAALAALDDLLVRIRTGRRIHQLRGADPLAQIRSETRWRPKPSEVLPKRTKRILECWADGLTDVQVADLFCVSYNTIHTTSSRIRSALRAKTRTHAVAIALRHGLIR
jgi:LuxR family transcriptional regulator